MLFLACIPSFLSMILLLRSYNTIIYTPLQDIERNEEAVDMNNDDCDVDGELSSSQPARPPVWRAFLATGITWLIYDFNVGCSMTIMHLLVHPIIRHYCIPRMTIPSSHPLSSLVLWKYIFLKTSNIQSTSYSWYTERIDNSPHFGGNVRSSRAIVRSFVTSTHGSAYCSATGMSFTFYSTWKLLVTPPPF